ncbi:MAG TPA: fibronectin type III domain-containing protein [Actinophytocola sp.]|uniref:fibronectin type III domain-containing protein n=1 Tax=Actinophytocola sp. TaxID=1872138 RepID=UPI002DDD08F7|nr:fibronectin type III domain-containing protein [Actinophytocola sp.]HEV2784324.1 fibronectin type III domain-containing protein [Actinophytocola sp.]
MSISAAGGCAVVILSAALAGCAGAPAEEGPGLTATLVSPTEISLGWQGFGDDAVGQVVEFATEPGGPYTILEFLPAGERAYRHADLMPETPFYYRVRAVLGPSSGTVDVVLPDGEPSDEDTRDGHEWAAPRVLPGGVGPPVSIRGGGGAPTGLTAVVRHADGIWFRWTDNAGDEEGFLIEARPRGHAEFRVAAVVDPNVNSFGLVTLPDEKAAAYRVRTFYFGQQTRVAHQRTGR